MNMAYRGNYMSMEERIWALDKNEASLLRSYFTEISTCHEEIDVIVAKKWDIVKKNKLLTRSIIRRMIAYYKYSKEYSDRKERPSSKEAGTYLEDIIFSPLKALLNEKFTDRFKVSRNKKIVLNGKSIFPDLVVEDTKMNNPVCVVEIKSWLDRSNWRDMKSRYDYCLDQGYLFICITGSIGGEKLKNEIHDVFWLTQEGFAELESEYDATIAHSIEDAFEKIVSRCESIVARTLSVNGSMASAS